jgi:tetratricopeptide (TPR) repeat protein
MSPGFQEFYNLNYDRAIGLFEQETSRSPEDPEAWNHLAQGIFYRRLYLAGALEGELVGASNSFLSRPAIAMPESERKRFLEAIQRSLQLTEARLKRDPGDEQALYANGVAHAHRAQYRLLVEKAYWDALRDGSASRRAHSALLKKNPGYADATLIPGMHEYVVGSLSPWARMMASLAGLGGNKTKGIALMERAVREASKTAVEARVFLALAYSREGQAEKSVPLLEELSAAFPSNWVYRTEGILLLARLGRGNAVEQQINRLEQWQRAGAPEAARMPAGKLPLIRGAAYVRMKDWAKAEEAYRAATVLAGISEEDRAKAWLGLGRVLDLQGRRAQAVPAYRESLRLAGQGSHLTKEAEAGLARAYR